MTITRADIEGEDRLEKYFDDAGLTDEYLASRLREETEACVSKHVKIKGNVSRTLDPRVKILAKSGTGVDALDVPTGGIDPITGEPTTVEAEVRIIDETLLLIEEVAHDVRLRAITEAYKMKGAYANKGEDSSDTVIVNVTKFSKEDVCGSDRTEHTE